MAENFLSRGRTPTRLKRPIDDDCWDTSGSSSEADRHAWIHVWSAFDAQKEIKIHLPWVQLPCVDIWGSGSCRKMNECNYDLKWECWLFGRHGGESISDFSLWTWVHDFLSVTCELRMKQLIISILRLWKNVVRLIPLLLLSARERRRRRYFYGTRKNICLKIKTFHLWRSFSLFSLPVCLIN